MDCIIFTFGPGGVLLVLAGWYEAVDRASIPATDGH